MSILYNLSMFGHSVILFWLAMTSRDFWRTRRVDRLQIHFFLVFLALTLDRLWSIVTTLRAVYLSSDRPPASHRSIFMFLWRVLGHMFSIGTIVLLVLEMRKVQKENPS